MMSSPLENIFESKKLGFWSTMPIIDCGRYFLLIDRSWLLFLSFSMSVTCLFTFGCVPFRPNLIGFLGLQLPSRKEFDCKEDRGWLRSSSLEPLDMLEVLGMLA